MRRPPISCLVLCAAALGLQATAAPAEPQTVCTVTVNSADERASFRRHLPESKYRFVELVERHRPDWLASACQSGVQCDVLVVSGHFDGNSEFFSDRLDVHEFLPIAELERASCSESCPGLLSNLKEVYLFGCNTLTPMADGGRDQMRRLFKGVPQIYGFTSTAPLGPTAGSTLDRYFQANGLRDIGNGRPNRRLLAAFAPFGMSVARGVGDGDPDAPARQAMCQFADERRSDASKLAFAHRLLQGPPVPARQQFDRIQRLAAALDDPQRRTPAVQQALADLVADDDARDRFLASAREARPPDAQVRMLDLARDLGWLTPAQRRERLVGLMGELLARPRIGAGEVNLACGLNANRELEGALTGLPLRAQDDAAHAALRACLGSGDARARMLDALAGSNESDRWIAQTYLRHRAITDEAELRGMAARIARMPASDAQVRALEALGRQSVQDRDTLALLTDLYAQTPSWSVQAAVAGVLIRADRHEMPARQLASVLIEHRRPSPAGDSLVDALIRTLQPP